MKYILLQAWAPLRAQPDSASEMVSSMVFGETCTLIEQKEEWIQVSCDFDHYKGWIPQNYLTVFISQYFGWKTLIAGRMARFLGENEEEVILSPGSNIPFNNVFKIDEVTYRAQEVFHAELYDGDAVQHALAFLNTPYLWGGRSAFGIDCSGFIQMVFKLIGMKIPRDASQQAKLGEEVPFEKSKPKDLAFFEKNGKITHVGMILDHQRIIHASVKVRIDLFTHQGIVHQEGKELTHHLAYIKRLL